MTGEILFVFALLAGTILVFIADKIRMDAVALGVMVILAISGVISPTQAISGFGEPVVIMIAGLFIVGEGLARTGVAASVGRRIMRWGGHSETRLMLIILPVVAVLSAFMSSTGAVALLIPVVLSMTRDSDIQASRVLMPMAFAALIGGMLTLIGTPPNIIVTDALHNAGLESFGFFAFTPLGVAVLVVGSLYLVFIARFLLPTRTESSNEYGSDPLQVLFERYELQDQLFRLSVPPGSLLIGQTVADAGLRSRYETTVFASRHRGHALSTIDAVLINSQVQAEDTLYVYGTGDHVRLLCADLGLQMSTLDPDERRRVQKFFGAMEILLIPQSPLEGRTLSDIEFRAKYGASVVGVRRQNQALSTDFSGTTLAVGDALLLSASWEVLRNLHGGRDFVILNQPTEMQDAPSHADKALHAIAIILGMIVLMTTGWLDNLTAILLAAVLMVATGCLNITEAYRSLNGRSLVLIAGMIPLALAMQSSGAAELLVSEALGRFGAAPPVVICGGIFLLTALLSQFISNTATTVLMAPITLGIAQGLGLNPMPFMMAVAIAASTAFATPIASPVNTLVVTPGNYQFMDFVKVGVPLQLLSMAVTLLMLPRLFPF
ncbi:SLC13 family permease [Salinispirillum sp. LH 10-3-1]|uniref:SLC13 family permease n=1 Tax=Salinispirillum sp. LH 10-3-1 TaxID=2952525 RepID=A0AB38YE28_9GAMM